MMVLCMHGTWVATTRGQIYAEMRSLSPMEVPGCFFERKWRGDHGDTGFS